MVCPRLWRKSRYQCIEKFKRDKYGTFSWQYHGHFITINVSNANGCGGKILKGRKLPPEFVVGCEGMFGMLIMLAIILPTVSHLDGLDGGGVHEDPIDAVHLIGSNGKLFALVGAYWISIAFYNFCGLAVAKSLSSVHRCLIDACRTVLVWSVDLLLYYYTNTYGELWIQIVQVCN